MEQTTIPAISLGAKAYTFRSNAEILACSPYRLHFKVLKDSVNEEMWEMFDTPSLPIYFNRGIDIFQEALDEFADLSRPLSKDAEKQLPFMLESLLNVRKLIAEIEE